MNRFFDIKMHEAYATLLSLFGMLLISIKYPYEGFLVSILASIFWLVYGIRTKQYGIVINSIGFFISETLGLINWGS